MSVSGSQRNIRAGSRIHRSDYCPFDPNFLAHGHVVGTDPGLACFLFAAIYADYCLGESALGVASGACDFGDRTSPCHETHRHSCISDAADFFAVLGMTLPTKGDKSVAWKKSAAQKSLSTNRIALLSSEVERNVAVPGSAVRVEDGHPVSAP